MIELCRLSVEEDEKEVETNSFQPREDVGVEIAAVA